MEVFKQPFRVRGIGVLKNKLSITVTVRRSNQQCQKEPSAIQKERLQIVMTLADDDNDDDDADDDDDDDDDG